MSSTTRDEHVELWRYLADAFEIQPIYESCLDDVKGILFGGSIRVEKTLAIASGTRRKRLLQIRMAI